MVGAIADKIEAGQMQLFCVDSVDAESWYNRRTWGRGGGSRGRCSTTATSCMR